MSLIMKDFLKLYKPMEKSGGLEQMSPMEAFKFFEGELKRPLLSTELKLIGWSRTELRYLKRKGILEGQYVSIPHNKALLGTDSQSRTVVCAYKTV